MSVLWEDRAEQASGWERVTARVGRCRLPRWDCTAGLVVGESAALLVDAGSSVAEGGWLREEAERSLGGGTGTKTGTGTGPVRRVTHLALTHPHFDHVFGAAAFGDAEVFGAVGIDVAYTARGREELRADAVRNGLAEDAAAEAARSLVPPRHHVRGEWTLDLGGGFTVLLADVGPGHTAHDLAVLVPATPSSPKVVFCGDLVEESGEPQAGPDAVPAHWPAALDRLLDLGGEDAVYVPGHGAVLDARFVRAQRDALARRFGVSP
ncbi:MBL fold metallo-hydrolase [Streptomyces sp. B3I8]|uniref:MBL fold metallo-hydrolase n=1 Tax=Streptomyces sp. B3I8 TaxID=3042303 RepID=UPI00278A6976|nr:MBL fold metallo-hydrolase [Streptomyces sp. B3I8]MDQ0786919.1 glyoxylase-like metal-dependent hydrolase (beta-lactamase superfamily II) [Streptomyces sp. B3I8]